MDSKIEDDIVEYIQKELGKETSILSDLPLINNSGCLESYISFLCKMNFKQCDPDSKTIT
jgi:hypothetical protein